MDKVFIIIGMAALAWPLVGILMAAFNRRIYISYHAPWSVRLSALAQCAFLLPWVFLQTGQLSGLIVREQDNDDPEEQAQFDAFLAKAQAACDCDGCRARRGDA